MIGTYALFLRLFTTPTTYAQAQKVAHPDRRRFQRPRSNGSMALISPTSPFVGFSPIGETSR